MGRTGSRQRALHSLVYVPPVEVDELFDDFFLPVARDGAGMVEVQVRLQKALAAPSRLDDPRFRKSARKHFRYRVGPRSQRAKLEDRHREG